MIPELLETIEKPATVAQKLRRCSVVMNGVPHPATYVETFGRSHDDVGTYVAS